MNVIGVDIVKGSPLSKAAPPYYAVAIISDDGKLVYEAVEVPLKTVIRLVIEYRVSRIGLDNVYEIAPTSRDLARILRIFPPDVEIYQVTIDEGKFVSLVEQASKIGIHIANKPRPLQTAYMCALLALNGIGTLVRGKARRTKIIVSRARSVGRGGSSANRFARGMRTSILRAVKEIKHQLDRAMISYDLFFRRGRGGLDSAVFIVYTDYEAIKRVVKPFEGNDIKVLIRPEYTSLEFVEQEVQRKKPVIVGIDPGIETGIAIVDLALQTIYTASAKELDRVSIVNTIYSMGVPVLIATDKNPPPESVKKLASTLGLPLYVPPNTLSVSEKERLVNSIKSRFCLSIETTHERDSLAAALKAYKFYEKKFLELERKLSELNIDVDIDELKTLLIQGKTLNEIIEYAIEMYIDSNTNDYSADTAIQRSMMSSIELEQRDRRLKALESEIKELIKENEILRSRVKELENKLLEKEFDSRFRAVQDVSIDEHMSRTVNELKERLKQVQNYLETLSKELDEHRKRVQEMKQIIAKLALNEYTAIPKLKSLTASSLQNSADLIKTSRAVLLSEPKIDLEALDIVKKLNIALIIRKCDENLKNALLEYGIPTICNINIASEDEDMVYVERVEFEEKIRKAASEAAQYLERKKSYVDTKKLIDIINEYRKKLRETTKYP